METLEIIFWIAAGCIAYAYLGYPLLLGAGSRFFGRPLRPIVPPPTCFSIVVAAYNEGRNIGRRVRELLALLKDRGSDCELIVVSDGSTDDTLELAIAAALECGAGAKFLPVRLPQNRGKAAALSAGVATATQPIIVFADARQRWTPQTLEYLLLPFSDPLVGAVSGDLVLESPTGALAGVSLYWKLEKWIRLRESAIHSTIGATGAICAVRRELFVPMQPGIILDDVCWPAAVSRGGHRVVHQPLAQAFDCLPARPADEFRRKVRTLSGNFQLLIAQPQILRPWRNPVCFGFISKKLMRLAVPWAMLVAVGCNVALVSAAPARAHGLYAAMLGLQAAGYILGIGGLCLRRLASHRLAAAAASLLVLNAAAFCAFWVWLSGRSQHVWQKARDSAVAGTVATANPTYAAPPCIGGAPTAQGIAPARKGAAFPEESITSAGEGASAAIVAAPTASRG